jgi:Icc protein
MKIVQITDLHIAENGEDTLGVDVRQNFQDILTSVRSLSPDLIVLTGDLCFDKGNEPTYQWVRSHLDFLETPYTAIGGNHDSPALLAKAFHIPQLLVGNELYYKREWDGHTALFLGTSSGEVSKTQLAWLENELALLHRDSVIFMHHPPIVGGAPFMDSKYALRNMAEVQSILFNFPHHLTIFCGHYHIEKTLCTRNLTVHITPSTYFQIDAHSEGFKVDHYRIACREINLRSDGVVESTVIYQEGNKTQ